MGQRGPAKTPAKIHKDRGTFRPDRHSGATLAASLPAAPRDLSDECRGWWKEIGTQLKGAGLITELDALALRLLVESIELYRQAIRESDGQLTIETDKGNLVQHPAIGIRNKAWGQIMKLCREFGLTPSARTGLPIKTKDEGSDRLQKLLGIKPQN